LEKQFLAHNTIELVLERRIVLSAGLKY
jgi:hypothetical protein